MNRLLSFSFRLFEKIGPWTRRAMVMSAVTGSFLTYGWVNDHSTAPAMPVQSATGPGGAAYLHNQVVFSDFAKKADGYWLFEPASPRPDSAHVVVFNHGYAAINPMAYGNWIEHLVRKGNIVIYPRYQRNMFFPATEVFPRNVAKAIRDAIAELNHGDHVRPKTSELVMVGHSYGGAISAYLGVKYRSFSIPQPKVLLLCSPGTGPFNGARLADYQNLPADTRLVILSNTEDHVVKEPFQRLIYRTATHTPARNFIRLYSDKYGYPAISSGHSECYSLNEKYDCGMRNPTIYRSYVTGKTDALDYNGYWKILDGLIDCLHHGQNCDYGMGNTPQLRSLGKWSDGKPIRELEVMMPQ